MPGAEKNSRRSAGYSRPVPEVLFSPFVATFVAAFVERIARFIGSSTKFATKMRILTGLGQALFFPRSSTTQKTAITLSCTRGPPVHSEVVGEDRGFLIRGGLEGRGTWRVFRGAGPGRFCFDL